MFLNKIHTYFIKWVIEYVPINHEYTYTNRAFGWSLMDSLSQVDKTGKVSH